jgi:antitoxin CcdA
VSILLAPKRPVNLSLNSELLADAKALGLNVSRIAEEALAGAIRERRAQDWLRENAGAIQDFNARIEERGVFSDGLRTF